MYRVFARLIDKVTDRVARRWADRWAERHYHPRALLQADAQREAADFIRAEMGRAQIVETRDDVLRAAFAHVALDGLVLEFGVAGGDSVRVLAELADGPVHGFDSFEGLPEAWPGRHEGAGHYSMGGRLPAVPATVSLHKGWFDDTLPGFLAAHAGPAAFVHIDCDLYASTRTVLDALSGRIVPGTVIVFDEFFNFPSWREHEYKAFAEFVDAHDIAFSYLCAGFQQVAVRIDGLAGA
jgi:predicted O-methyltransferase YrrM